MRFHRKVLSTTWRRAAFCALGCATILAPGLAAADVVIDWIDPTGGLTIGVDAANHVYTADYEYNPAGDIVLTKRSADGTFLWQTRFDQTDATKWERAAWLEVDGAGDVVVAGTLMSGYSNPVEAASILMKFSPDGALAWRRVYESSFDGSYVKKCLVGDDDSIYVLGMGSGPGGYVTKVKKFDPNGDPIWTWFDGAGIGAPINFKFTPDGGLVIAARSIFGSINGYAKIDLDGNGVWSQPGIESLTVGDVAGDQLGNSYLVHGESVPTDPRTVVRKLGPTGTLQWANVYDLSGFRVEVGSDDRAVVSGFPSANSGGASFVKIDGDGSVVWANPSADGGIGLLLHSLMRVDDQGAVYLAAGTLFEMAICKVAADGTSEWTALMPGSYTRSFALGLDRNVYVVGGRTAKLVQEPVADAPLGMGSSRSMACFPNPTRGATTLRYELREGGPVTLGLFDAAGRRVRELAARWEEEGIHEIRLRTEGLAAGVYLAELRSGRSVETVMITLVR